MLVLDVYSAHFFLTTVIVIERATRNNPLPGRFVFCGVGNFGGRRFELLHVANVVSNLVVIVAF